MDTRHDLAVAAAAAVLSVDPADVRLTVRDRAPGRPRGATDDQIRVAVAAARSYAEAARAIGISSRALRRVAARLQIAPISAPRKEIGEIDTGTAKIT